MSLLRDAVRSLRASPGTSGLIVFALALGTAANSAVFSVVDAVLFRSLHARKPERLVRIYGWPPEGSGGFSNSSSFPVYADYRDQGRSFAALAAGGLLSELLFGVAPADPWNLLAVAGVLVLTALVASLVPARRALRVDPTTALRSE